MKDESLEDFFWCGEPLLTITTTLVPGSVDVLFTPTELLHCYHLCLEKCLLYDRLFYLSKLEKSRLSAGFSFRCRRERWLWTHNSVNFINQKIRPYIRGYIFVEWTIAAKVENMSQWSNRNILMAHLQWKVWGICFIKKENFRTTTSSDDIILPRALEMLMLKWYRGCWIEPRSLDSTCRSIFEQDIVPAQNSSWSYILSTPSYLRLSWA